MLKKAVLLCLFPLLLFAVACQGGPVPDIQKPTPIEAATLFFNVMPATDGLVFFGIAGKRSDPKETLQFALEDAARRVAVFHQVYGEYVIKSTIGSGTFDYTTDTQTFLSYDDGKQYVDALQFDADTDTLEIENTVIVRTTYPAALPATVSYYPVYGMAKQRPAWVETPPKIAGYETGVGYSSRYSSFADTCTNSYHNAIFAIIKNKNVSIQSTDVMYWTNENIFGYRTDSDNLTYSYGTLTGFYALDTWIDPKAKTVWTLAIARKE